MLKCFSPFFFSYLDSVHSSWVLISFPREQFKKNRSVSIMRNKEWDFRKLKDIEGNGSKHRHWEFLFRAWEKDKELANSVKDGFIMKWRKYILREVFLCRLATSMWRIEWKRSFRQGWEWSSAWAVLLNSEDEMRRRLPYKKLKRFWGEWLSSLGVLIQNCRCLHMYLRGR